MRGLRAGLAVCAGYGVGHAESDLSHFPTPAPGAGLGGGVQATGLESEGGDMDCGSKKGTDVGRTRLGSPLCSGNSAVLS